jgi:hypothetical protein
MRQGVAHEMHAAALPGCGEDLRDGGLDARVRVRDRQLDAIKGQKAFDPISEGDVVSRPRRASPRLASVRRKSTRKASASDAPIDMPSTSRRPSVLTPTAMITATEMMRPFW